MARTRKYCYLKPEFPEKALVALIFLVNKSKEEVSFTLPLNSLYTSTEDIRLDMEHILAQLRDNTNVLVEIPATLILLPAVFYTLYPLKRKYWRRGGKPNRRIDRSRWFLPVAGNPRPFMLLATPAFFDKKSGEWEFSAALPLPLTANDADIEKLIMEFDYPVEEKAQYAALYTFGKPLRFNWRTGEIFPESCHIHDEVAAN